MADESDGIPPGLLETVKSAIGKDIEVEFAKKVKFESKGEKSEGRVLALSGHRLYVLLITKTGAKVDFSIHILGIQKLESDKPLKLNVHCGEKQYLFKVLQIKDSIEIIAHITAFLKSTLPAGNPDRLLQVSLGPSEEKEQREAQVTTLVNNLLNAELDTEPGPCGGFSRVYASMCDFYGQPLLEEVVWDVDTIYLSHNSKVFNLQDFDHLDQKDMVPLIATLEYNDWFTKLDCTSCKLSSDVFDAIIRVVKKSTAIEEIMLDSTGLHRDYCQKLALALISNPKTAIHTISSSNNSVEDRGLINVAGTFGKLPHGLVHLAFSDVAVTSKGVIQLGQALKNSKYMDGSLKRLDLSKNSLKADGLSALADFLAKPNALTYLDLSSTECSLDMLFGALIRGCLQNLAVLNLSGNVFTSRKVKEVTVPPTFQQFFSSAQSLKSVDLSDCKLPAEAVRALLTGLSENQAACGVELNLSKNELKASGGKAIANCIGSVHSVSHLDLSDNGLESDLIKILERLASNQSIHHLNIGQNVKGRGASQVMEALVHLISIEDSPIQSLSLADSKLKSDMILFLDALGTNDSLIELDISGNSIGDEGARILAKGLQLNSKLRTLLWDRNGTTYRGFADIAAALNSNHTLHSMPMPLQDAAQSLKPQTEHHLREIEKKLLRNQSPHKVVTEQAYRLQQGLMVTSVQQQSVDRLVVQLQENMSNLRHSEDPEVLKELDTTKRCIQDADKLKQLLLKFQLCTSDADIETTFSELTANLHQAAENKMKDNIEKMLACASEVCPFVTSKQEVQDHLRSLTEGKSKLSKTFVEEVLLTQAAAAILNQLSEDKLTVASIVADDIMDMVIQHLESSVLKLDLLLKEHHNKVAEEKDKVSIEEDDIAAAAKKARSRLSQSAQMLGVPDGTDSDRLGGRSNKRRPTFSRRPVAKVEEETAESKKPAAAADLDLSVVAPQSAELSHLGKARARPARGRRPPTRPSQRPTAVNGTDNQEGDKEEGIEDFWAPVPEKAEVKKVKKSSSAEPKKSPPKAAPRPAPKPAPKPSPKPKASERRIQTTPEREDQEGKKAGWKGGLNIGLPGFFRKKSRDRAATTEEKSRTEFYSSRTEKVDPQAAEEVTRKKSASLKEPSQEKPTSLERKPSQEKPPSVLAPKPFVLPRDRTASGSGLKPMPREKSVSERPAAMTRPQPPAESPTSKEAPKTNAPEPSARVQPKGPPKFGVGFGGPAGGGLLAEMKLRQERGSVGKRPVPEKRTPEKDAETKNESSLKPSPVRPRLPSGTPPKPAAKPRKDKLEKKDQAQRPEDQKDSGTKTENEVPQEKEKKESPRPEENDAKTEKENAANKSEKEPTKEEEGLDNKKDEVETTTTKKDEQDEQGTEKDAKPEKSSTGQDGERDKQEPEKPKEKLETGPAEKGSDEEKMSKEEKPASETKDTIKGTAASSEKENGYAGRPRQGSESELWKIRSGEKPSPDETTAIPRSKSLSYKPGSRAGDRPAITGRSATLPKPYSPGRPSGAVLSRTLSWEMPTEPKDRSKKEVKEKDTIDEEKPSNKSSDSEVTEEHQTSKPEAAPAPDETPL